MKIHEINYKILKDFLIPLEEHQKEFEEIDFSNSGKNEQMQTTFGKPLKIKKIFNYLQDYFKKHRMTIDNIWAQKYINGRHSTHVHYPADASFVWYIKADNNCSEILFYNPGWPYVRTHEFKIQPYTGTLLFFDATIPHEVLENKNQVRNIIAGNLSWPK